jgi:uncharacterized protein involved in cysteine biosynthesis
MSLASTMSPNHALSCDLTEGIFTILAVSLVGGLIFGSWLFAVLQRRNSPWVKRWFRAIPTWLGLVVVTAILTLPVLAISIIISVATLLIIGVTSVMKFLCGINAPFDWLSRKRVTGSSSQRGNGDVEVNAYKGESAPTSSVRLESQRF